MHSPLPLCCISFTLSFSFRRKICLLTQGWSKYFFLLFDCFPRW